VILSLNGVYPVLSIEVGSGSRTFLPADLSTAHAQDLAENCSTAVLPAGAWFLFNSTTVVSGGRRVTQAGLALSEFPVYPTPQTQAPNAELEAGIHIVLV